MGTVKTKETMVLISLRIPKEVLEFYKQFPKYTKLMRKILIKGATVD